MKRTLIAGLLALAFSIPGYSYANLPNDIEANQWNLKDLYMDRAAWDKDAKHLETQLTQLEKCSGHLGSNAKQFKECLDLTNDILKRYARLANYAAQYRDQDTGNNAGQDIAQSAEILGSKVESASSFLRPELLTLGQKKIDAFLARDKSLAGYAFYLHDILRGSKHTLDKKGEELVATFGMATNAASAVYATLSNADMPWPKLKLSNGEEVVIDQSAYTKYRASGNRADRKLVFDAFWGKWKEFERSYGVTFYEQLKKDSAYAKVRNYPDSLTSALDGNDLPRAVYDTLVSQTQANLPTLHRYFQLRAKMLGVSDLRYYDIYPALVTGNYHYPIEDGVKLMLASVKPLGEDYVAAMTKATTERWMDVYPRPHKRSGAYMSGTAYDVHPYLLLNYNDDYESVSTLGHEWGHAMHSYLANKNQSFLNSDYPTFTAEIASTTNEVFLLDHMLKIAKTDDERLLYLGSALENLRGTFFRQAMFADFEREVHARVDKGESLTGEGLSKIYGDILKRYHGDKEGVMKIDDTYAVEWAYIPHFYNRFYVFQYATSIAAGSMFADEILKGEPGARDKYLNILKAGASAYPYDLVKNAGVDLASPAPYQAVFKRMNTIMDQIEAILAKRK
ncbi:oligoendopeptidase F [Undibacterium jejuense]|uniref:Oligopeptidase F n=1 Tax=Undibacterium jejuense TaxID=1344949 RepID=A0A923HI82_9BURK|nr:oligoendopeptidase F [Undibacterium jejuense]MBC3864204.1 oligoendopeptidase F [Undibacterium jejuense]